MKTLVRNFLNCMVLMLSIHAITGWIIGFRVMEGIWKRTVLSPSLVFWSIVVFITAPIWFPVYFLWLLGAFILNAAGFEGPPASEVLGTGRDYVVPAVIVSCIFLVARLIYKYKRKGKALLQ